MGVDAYYKDARDMLDDGQFGAAVVLTQFNYAEGYSEGGEFKLKYTNGNFKAYANFAYNITEGKDVESNQYLIDAADYNYLLTHWHYTDDMQLMTGSAGASYRWYDTLFTISLIYGSGLRSGDLSLHRRSRPIPSTRLLTRWLMSACRTISNGRRTPSRSPCASTSSTCSIGLRASHR